MDNTGVKSLEATDLAAVQGGKGAAYNPFDPFGVGAYWQGVAKNTTGAWMSMMPLPFQTPTFPLGY